MSNGGASAELRAKKRKPAKLAGFLRLQQAASAATTQ
jgi:hypothetical protein